MAAEDIKLGRIVKKSKKGKDIKRMLS